MPIPQRRHLAFLAAFLAAVCTAAAPYVIDVDPEGASLQTFPGGANVASLPTTLEISINNTRPTKYEITKVKKLTSSLLTPWQPSSANAIDPILDWEAILAGLPPEQWYGKFDVTFKPIGGGNGGGGGGGSAKELTITALVSGDSDGELLIRPTDDVVCKNTSPVPFYAWVERADGSEEPAPCDWQVYRENTTTPSFASGANTATYPVPVAGTLLPDQDPDTAPDTGIYDVVATLVNCPGIDRPSVTATLEVIDLHEIEVNTQSTAPFQVCADGSLSLTANSTGSDFPAGLPTWTSSPAGVTFAETAPGTVEATFPNTLAGQTITITADACGTQKTIEVIVYQADVDPPNYVHDDTAVDNERTDPPGSEDERVHGGWLVVNDDHDLADTTWDLDATYADKSTDPRILPLAASVAPITTGTDATLTWDDTKIAVHDDTAGTTLSSPATIAPADLAGLKIEGITPSDNMQDIEITLEYPAGTNACPDTITMSVIRIDLDVDSNNDDIIDPDEFNNAGSAGANSSEDAAETNGPGKITVLNDDDSDGDGKADIQDPVTGAPFINGTDDLEQLAKVVIRQLTPTDIPTGTLHITGDGVRLFKVDDVTSPHTTSNLIKPLNDQSADLFSELQSGDIELYAEAETFGTYSLILTYENATNSAMTATDTVNLTFVQLDLLTDIDRDRSVGDMDKAELLAGKKFFFWKNDDRDSGDVLNMANGLDDVPGGGGFFSSGNSDDTQINGVRDLVDFAPLLFRIKPQSILDDPSINLFLHTSGGAIQTCDTELDGGTAGDYLDIDTTAKALDGATLTNVAGSRVQLSAHAKNKILTAGEAVVIFEGKDDLVGDLVFDLGNSTRAFAERKLPVSVKGVELMFRHQDIRTAGGGSSGHPNRTTAPNFPDDPIDKNNFIFIHGYNVNADGARSSHAEIFKRMYWTGSKARFWGVTWRGDQSQISIPGVGNIALNYHVNIRNAFDSAPALSNLISSINSGGRETTVLAHSMGNIIGSSAIADHSAPVVRYYMMNAAMAIEVIDPLQRDQAMIHPAWRDTDWREETAGGSNYDERFFASNWFKLFPSNDKRSKLSWRARFAGILGRQVVNFYSRTEDVLPNFNENWETGLEMNPTFYPSANAIAGVTGPGYSAGTSFTGKAYPWATQELLKGRHIISGSGFGGSEKMGWGFNGFWISGGSILPPHAMNSTIFGPGGNPSVLQTQPLFKDKPSDLFQVGIGPTSPGSTYAAANHNTLLGDAIPAVSFAVASNSVSAITNSQMDHDLPGLEWPVWNKPEQDGGRRIWRHSDFKNVAYLYTIQVYDEFTSLGGFK